MQCFILQVTELQSICSEELYIISCKLHLSHFMSRQPMAAKKQQLLHSCLSYDMTFKKPRVQLNLLL